MRRLFLMLLPAISPKALRSPGIELRRDPPPLETLSGIERANRILNLGIANASGGTVKFWFILAPSRAQCAIRTLARSGEGDPPCSVPSWRSITTPAGATITASGYRRMMTSVRPSMHDRRIYAA